MSFADIKGQDSAVSFLKTSLKNNKLSHAYIFCGPGGIGKALTAVNFAKAIVCQNAVSYEPCDKCPSCKKIDNLSHPDVSILKAEKDRGTIKIDDIRKLIKDIYLRPFEAKKKVYIIDQAQDMKHEAANALLKTLEEPPTDSILILITDNLKALFHTIVSRSQVVRFYPLKPDQIKELLIGQYSLDEKSAHVLSRLSCGRLGEAVKYNDEDVFAKRSSLIDSVSKRSLNQLSFDDVPKEKLVLYLDILLAWFKDIASAKAGVDNSMLVNIDKKDIISNEAKRLSFEYLEDVIGSVISTISYLDQNANAKLAMSVLGVKICEV
ncbi:MAG: DNA polymerase III subunit delta' [Candidatus Omnitrophota bacterium]|nr:DNA polymerase III subunit delta' [Candidatus Omnitrophota bacterium]